MAHLAIDMFLLVLLIVLIMTDSFLSRRRWSSVSMSLSADEQRSIDTFNKVKSQCVYVSSLSTQFNLLSFNTMEVDRQSGSGWVWPLTKGQHVVTNYHVVAAGNMNKDIKNMTVLVTFIQEDNTRASYKAKVCGGDASRDIAVLSLLDFNHTITTSTTSALSSTSDGESAMSYSDTNNNDNSNINTNLLSLGNSSTLQVGQRTMAIGSPFGLDHSLTQGIISGLGRRVSNGRVQQVGSPSSLNFDMIQTDAAINPGNSGGPLLDSDGRVIGMNTAIYSTSGAFAGVGFAISVDTIRIIVDLLLREGRIRVPQTGLQLIGGTTAKALNVDKGLVVIGVEKGSAAARAGIRAMPPISLLGSFSIDATSTTNSSRRGRNAPVGDVITHVNNEAVRSEADFIESISFLRADNIINVTILRQVGNGPEHKEIDLKLRLT